MQTSKDDNLERHELSIEREGRSIPLYYAGPRSLQKMPALILVHEIFGVNEHIEELAERFARLNLRVFAADIFACHPDFPQDTKARDLETMRNIWSSIPDSQLISDLVAVFNHVYAQSNVVSNSIGTIGYCMGGAIAFMFACSEPRLAWIIDYYGRIEYATTSATKPRHPIDYATSLKCPLLALFAGIDDLIPAEHIDKFTKQLEKLNKTFQLKVYEEAPHAFFNDQRPNYRADAANDAWQLTVDFIRKNSKEECRGPL